MRAGIIGKGGFHINSGNPALLPYSSIPYLQGNVHIAAFASDVVGIEGLGVTASQYTTFATRLAIVQAFPSIVHIGLTLFFSGVIYLRRMHGY